MNKSNNNIITPTFRTCKQCRIFSDDVVSRLVYVGGQGYVKVDECEDRTSCWQRIDKRREQNEQ